MWIQIFLFILLFIIFSSDIMMKKMRYVHNFSAKVFKGVLFTGAQTSKKLGKALFHHIFEHLPIPRQWYVEKIWFRDLYKTWAKLAKGSLFTGAQASKNQKKLLFTTSVSIFQIRHIDMLKMIDSEICTKLEQRESKAPCSQAQKQAKAGKSVFSTHLWASF